MLFSKIKINRFKYLQIGQIKLIGRNRGRLSNYHRGGGYKHLFRIIDFYKYIWNVWGYILKKEYDPNRSSILFLIYLCNNCILYTTGIKDVLVGAVVEYGFSNKYSFEVNIVTARLACVNYLRYIKPGCFLNVLQLNPKGNFFFKRCAGNFIKFLGYISLQKKCILLLKKNKHLQISDLCIATIGRVDNIKIHKKNFFYTAGWHRRRGYRPVVRGVAMNPVDHPHGGGQGKTSGGRPSVSPWGKLTKGPKTRRQKLNIKNIKLTYRFKLSLLNVSK